ncbi:MAG: aminopeptidase P family N-terminal domain-containing protein, partial [Lachnospiraceae bacterium]
MNMVRETINRLRAVMKEKGVDAYLVPTADFHDSEYAGEYFRTRAYLSGFTGSAGTLLVMGDEAGLWTDGRYFVQAGRQLDGSGIDLYKSGQPGVPTIF